MIQVFLSFSAAYVTNQRGAIYGVVLITLSQGKMTGGKESPTTSDKVGNCNNVLVSRAMQQCENAQRAVIISLFSSFHFGDSAIKSM